jgi:Flp pilus assembly protein TadD
LGVRFRTSSSKIISLLIAALFSSGGFAQTPQSTATQPKAAASKAKTRESKSVEAARLNNLGAAYMNQQQFARALELFREAASTDPSLYAAQLNQGIALFNLQKPDEARSLLLKATELDPQSAVAWYNLGLLYKSTGQKQDAIGVFTRAVELAKDDPDARYFLGAAQSDAGDQAAAIRTLQSALSLNPYHVSAEFAIARAYQRSNDATAAREHLVRFQQLTQKKLGAPISLIYGEQGKLSLAQQVRLPAAVNATTIPVHFSDVSGTMFPSRTSVKTKSPTQIPPTAACVLDFDADGTPDLLSTDGPDSSAHLYRNNGKGAFTDVTTQAGLAGLREITACAGGDFNNDNRTDVALASAAGVLLFRNNGKGGFENVTKPSVVSAGASAHGLTWIDYDHDGDLDLFIASASDQSRSALWRNNGNGTFTDVTADTGFGLQGVRALLPTDFNNDRAIDAVLLSSSEPVKVLTNPREGKFELLPVWTGNAPIADTGTIFDFDKNGSMDLLLTGDQSPALTLWSNDGGRRVKSVNLPALSWKRAYSVAAFDYDNDGWLDFAAVGENADGGTELRIFRDLGTAGFRDVTKELGLAELSLSGRAAITAFDFDGDGDTDLLITQGGGQLVLLRNDGGNRNNWLRLALKGLNDNKSAVGAKLEVFAGDLWQKFEITGMGAAGQSATDIVLGLGHYTQTDIVRVLWPTGVLQDEIEIAANKPRELLEIDRRGSSCPVLFAWDGTRYRFISDMLGSGVIGHWVAPGELNVPDPTEYVKLEGVSPALKDGRLSFRFLEPMEESVYVDQLRLLAIDHPEDVDVFPNEYFASAPPFPDFKVIASRNATPVPQAWDDAGRDVTSLLRERDRHYVESLEMLPFKGFTRTHRLELDLGQPYQGGPLRLLLYGYIEYFTATGMFSAHQAGVDPMAPTVDALVNGKWVRVIDDMGFPAGLPRTTVAELTDRLPVGAQRIRITTNLQIYWDQILIDRTTQTQTIKTHEVPLASAKLGFLGYPRAIEASSPGDLTYVYEEVSKTGPYTRQNGAYTRFGNVTDLVSHSDDAFAIFGSGEEIAVDFDPSKLPELPVGWKRDYFFFADGYEKDMDFYAADFLSVEPLPFHSMDTYPGRNKQFYPVKQHLGYLLERNDRLGSTENGNEYRFHYHEP